MLIIELNRRELGIQLGAASVAAMLPSEAGADTQATDVAIPTRWDLTALYLDAAAWERARIAVLTTITQVATSAVTIRRDEAGLETSLRSRSDCRRAVMRLGAYAALAADAALDDGQAQERRQRADAVSAAFEAASLAVDDAVRQLGRTSVAVLLAQRPALGPFRRGIERALRTNGVGPAGADAALAATTASEIYQQLSAAIPRPTVTLADGRAVRLTQPVAHQIAESSVRPDRQASSAARAANLRPFVPVFAATLGAYARGQAEVARRQGYPDAAKAALGADSIPPAVLTTVIAQAHRGLPVLHRYVELRRRRLGLEELRLFDLSVPLSRARPSFPIARIRSEVLAAVAPLGRDYQAAFARATLSPWMDAYPRPGKYAGGYTNYDAYDVHPYLLLNLGDDYMAASTFAHEWGHAMHAVLAHAAQPFELADLSTFTTEVASTCHEQLLVRHLIDAAPTADERLFYLWQKAAYQVGFFFQTAMQTEFELFLHGRVAAGEGISSDPLCAEWRRLLQLYWGPSVHIDEEDGYGWTSNWQLYNAFYNFQYATSVTGAVHFATKLRSDPGASTDYLAMLKAGGSDDPYTILKAHGVDLGSATPYEAFVADFGTTLDLIERQHSDEPIG